MDWLTRMKANLVKGEVKIRKIRLEELVEPLGNGPGDDWLICKVFKTHVVNSPPIECSKCFCLQCPKCHDRLKDKTRCPNCYNGDEEDEFKPSTNVNKIAPKKN